MNGFNRQAAFLFAAWLLSQVFWYVYTGGVFEQEEAVVYTHIADNLSKGRWDMSAHFWLYAGYIGPLLLLKFIGLSYGWMYLFQLVLSLIALIAFHKLLNTLQLKSAYVFWGTLLYATCPFIQNWNVYLYTDAFFSHFVVILLFLLAQKQNRKYFFGIVALLLLVSFTRPLGFLLIAIAAIFYFLNKKGIGKITFLGICFAGLTVLVFYFMKTGKDFYYANHNLETNIICGLTSSLKQYEANPYQTGMSPVKYMITNPELTIRLLVARLYKSLWMTRPYYSGGHNLFIMLTLFIYYIPALWGLYISIRRKKHTFYPFLLGIAILLIPNMLLCADWHNRFMAPILPFILVFTALGLQTGSEMLKKPEACMDSPVN